ncbi:hypothetical protein OQB66_14890 [Pseudomonas syringae]|uniref:hypothetical protein n=1 Tax=Pseudomonas syringae TaxID=317 RepID=UPI00224B7E80|nr:hypothetical protein [Pseudomonas syringae]UZS70874.1 hypothetical protein OQB66_14890 [Pseudomonas syringae]
MENFIVLTPQKTKRAPQKNGAVVENGQELAHSTCRNLRAVFLHPEKILNPSTSRFNKSSSDVKKNYQIKEKYAFI